MFPFITSEIFFSGGRTNRLASNYLRQRTFPRGIGLPVATPEVCQPCVSMEKMEKRGKKGSLDHLHGTQHYRWSHGDSSTSLLLVFLKKKWRHILQLSIFSISKHSNILHLSIKGNHITSFFDALLFYFHLVAFLKNHQVNNKVRRDQSALRKPSMSQEESI